ncbi:MAG: DNA-directed DNA polymerase II small subunit [Candidatus Poseidoniaceae archaeon]|jgi:DNA polymerase II small subunit|nr:DNA-directed DNA polymerase II small subunit [Candidatus Poseidoniaceae archaeon]
MPASWAEIFPHLMRAKLIATRGVKDKLVTMEDPFSIIRDFESKGIMGPITLDMLPTKSIGRTVAPIAESEPENIEFRNNLPDWRKEDFPMEALDVSVDLSIHYDITGNSTTEGKMVDINAAFTNRLERLRKLIIKNSNLPRRPMEIARLQAERGRFQARESIAVAIGLVNDPRHTKNGHLMFGLEDSTGEMNCLLMNRTGDDRIIEHSNVIESGLMPDDVVGVSGSFSANGDLFYIDDLHFPMEDRHEKSYSDTGVSVAFLSDIHVGSKTFLEAQWMKMAKWFNTDPLARTIKYLVLSGDCVDGVGIYPGQDKELAIKDLYGQYSRFAELLELLPEWVECIMLPGNHDAVRPAEPQPTLEPDIQQDFNATTFVGNPCDFSLHGVRLLSYHGKSIDDFVAGLRTVTYSDPVEAMRQMLRRRHLAPQWGGKTPLSPEPEDGLVIREVPDIFVTGHVHGHECVDFRGTTLICSSTWQDQTSYQRMLGFQPKPCMLTVVNLGTHKTTAIPFA